MEFENFGKVLSLLRKERLTEKQVFALVSALKVNEEETVEKSAVSGVTNDD